MTDSTNLISYTMSDAEFADIKNDIKLLHTKLSFMVDVSDDELLGFNKLSDGDKVFISDCLTESEAAADFLPSYFKVAEVKKDDKLHDQLWEIEDALAELLQKVRRNRMLAGHEAYSGVSTFYNLIKAAAKSKIAVAVAMFNRLQSYHLKKVEAAKAAKKKLEAAALAAAEAKAAEIAAAQKAAT